MRKIFAAAAIAAFLLCTGIAASGQDVKTTQKTPEQVAQALVDAANARDMDGILKTYAPDSTAYALPSGEVILKGHEALRKKFARILEPGVKLKVEIVNRIVDGKFVIDKEKITGTADGKPVEFYGTVIYEIVDGLIRREWYPRQ